MILFLLFTKHLIFDFFYQPPYQWQNKGTYGHWGGIVHSFQHALATWLILCWFAPLLFSTTYLAVICLGEFVVHYHMDWFKMWYNRKKGWKCNTHNEFWLLTGVDQYVHALTYLAIALFVG